ncbi:MULTISPECIES: hypothetical protein [Brucella/Ochrobactrum group]|uniref:hypothetical protein n=1 Tax=Brucella/Ochrobactrum group TaxID=2826938 RepID=UPI000DEEC292|nr:MULTISPECIES: hypothetical protein [Brucella/Ochrobactrum group]WGG58142.1 hypothetical protein QA414_07130 [Brucella intermedia]
MTEKNWKWYSGDNNESFLFGPFDSREEAIAEARAQNGDNIGVYVTEAYKEPLKLSAYMSADTIETILENAESTVAEFGDEYGEYTTFDVSDEQAGDLRAILREAIDAWQEKHGLKFTTWCFTDSRNEEYIKANP